MQKLLTFFSKNINIYMPIFNDQSFTDMLTNKIVSFEQLGLHVSKCFCSFLNKSICSGYTLEGTW